MSKKALKARERARMMRDTVKANARGHQVEFVLQRFPVAGVKLWQDGEGIWVDPPVACYDIRQFFLAEYRSIYPLVLHDNSTCGVLGNAVSKLIIYHMDAPTLCRLSCTNRWWNYQIRKADVAFSRLFTRLVERFESIRNTELLLGNSVDFHDRDRHQYELNPRYWFCRLKSAVLLHRYLRQGNIADIQYGGFHLFSSRTMYDYVCGRGKMLPSRDTLSYLSAFLASLPSLLKGKRARLQVADLRFLTRIKASMITLDYCCAMDSINLDYEDPATLWRTNVEALFLQPSAAKAIKFGHDPCLSVSIEAAQLKDDIRDLKSKAQRLFLVLNDRDPDWQVSAPATPNPWRLHLANVDI